MPRVLTLEILSRPTLPLVCCHCWQFFFPLADFCRAFSKCNWQVCMWGWGDRLWAGPWKSLVPGRTSVTSPLPWHGLWRNAILLNCICSGLLADTVRCAEMVSFWSGDVSTAWLGLLLEVHSWMLASVRMSCLLNDWKNNLRTCGQAYKGGAEQEEDDHIYMCVGCHVPLAARLMDSFRNCLK